MVTIPSSQFPTCIHVVFTKEEGEIFSSDLDVPIYILYLEGAAEELNTCN